VTGLASVHDVHVDVDAAGVVSVGRPVPGAKIYVLDGELAPVPVGVPGELYVGGAGVTSGYVDDARPGSASFVRDPFEAGSEARLFRSGDLARYRADGTIEIVGPAHRRVAIGGMFVVLPAVEAALLQHDGVREAAVVALRGVGSDDERARVVGYVGVDGGGAAPPTASDLQAFLAARLPELVVPAEIVVLERLPRTSGGKIDAAALPAPGGANALADERSPESWNDIERGLATIWKETLDLDSVQLDDDFFDIGGHSLLLIRVFNRLHEVVECDVQITDLFKHRTIRTLASFLAK